MSIIWSVVLDWLSNLAVLETSGMIAGVLAVYLAAKNNIWSWPIGIINVAIYIVVFFDAKLYADMGLQLYFMCTNLYGWYFWSRKSAQAPQVQIRAINKREFVLSVFAVSFFAPFVGFALQYHTDASFPYIDSFCTACSLVAQFFLARKIKENWLIWIFVDLIYVGVYLVKGLYPTAIMYSIFIYIAAVGYLDWRSIYRLQQ